MRPRAQLLIGAAALALLAGPSLAADSSKDTLTNPLLPMSGQVFTDCTSKGGISSSGTKQQMKMSNVSAPDTDGTHCTPDDYICLGSSTDAIGSAMHCVMHPTQICSATLLCPAGDTCGPAMPTTLDATLVLHAEAKAGVIQFKHDVCKDSTKAGDPPGSGGLCSGAAVPVAAFNSDMVCYKPDPAWTAAHPPTIGLQPPHQCEGVILLQRGADSGGTLPVPANGIVARQGSSICK